MMRYVLIPLAVLLLLVVAAAVLLPLLIDEHKLLARAADELHKQTGATLTVQGDTRLTLFPTVGVSLKDAAITLPQAQQPDLHIGALEVGVRPLPLLSRKIEIDRIELDGVTLHIDAAQLPEHKTVRADQVAAGAGTALAVPAALNVRELLITGSRLEVVDGSSTTVVELNKLKAKNLNLAQQPIALELQLRKPGQKPLELSVQGTARLNLQSQQIMLEGVTSVLSGATPNPVTLHTSGSIDLTQEAGDLDVSLEQGSIQGTGKLHYANQASPRLNATVHFNQFDPALLVLAGPQALTAADKPQVSAARNETLPLETLRLIDTHAVADIDEVHFGVHTINKLHLELTGSGGVIDVSALRGELHGGELDGIAKLDATTDTAILTTGGTLSGVDIAKVLAATNSKPVLSGQATLKWLLHGSGRTSDELISALQGPIKLSTEAVVLPRISVEKLLCQTVALTNNESLKAPFPPDTQFKSLTADIELRNGAATLKSLNAALTGVALNGSGNYDLLKKDFSVDLKARLSQELEQADHACRVSKRLLAFDFPVECAGNVDSKPAKWCQVNVAQVLHELTDNDTRDKLEQKAGKMLDKLLNHDKN
jgi:uncharacterized protein involved in outer membrane biogenesis